MTTPDPQAIVIFGASGDLTRRKILPALYDLSCAGVLPERCAIVGYARSDWDDDRFREIARQAIEQHARAIVDDEHWKPFCEALSYVSGPFDSERCFMPLREHLHDVDRDRGTEERRLFYCATPPSAFPLIVHRLDEAGMAEGNRIVVEKPFGSDLASARKLSDEIHRAFDESRVFRIDHYLGKETVQNLLVFRFANSLFERVWNRDTVDHVQITVAESAGIGSRAGYYEEAGVIRDMVQNHLMQLLSFLAMDPPRSFEPEAVRDEKVKLLRAIRPFEPDDTVWGQYRGGRTASEAAAGYRDEPGVDDGSNTATFTAVRARIDNWRWDRVPFYLRTGKRLPRRVSEIMVVFKEVPAYLQDEIGRPPADHLVIRVQPEEGISFSFQAKRPGAGLRPKTVKMEFSYSEEFPADPADAYERLLEDAMRGDLTLFTRADEVERAWEIVAPLLDGTVEPAPYEAGSWGPEAADDLIAPRRWHLHE